MRSFKDVSECTVEYVQNEDGSVDSVAECVLNKDLRRDRSRSRSDEEEVLLLRSPSELERDRRFLTGAVRAAWLSFLTYLLYRLSVAAAGALAAAGAV